jgi:hypothetical protein
MPKIIFESDEKNLIPEHLQGEAKEVDGKFELDAAPVLKKNKELLGKNATLTTRAEEAEAAKEVAEAARDEWKGKAKIPDGQKVVPEDVAELGTAAKEAGLVKDEIPTLKTAKADIEAQLEAVKGERVVEEVAKANELNEKFVELAKDKGLKFEKKLEKVDEKDVDVWYVVGEKDSKPENTKLDDFFEKDAFFSKFAGDFTNSGEGENGTGGKKWVRQESGKDGKTVPGAQTTINNRYGKTVASLTKTEDAK